MSITPLDERNGGWQASLTTNDRRHFVCGWCGAQARSSRCYHHTSEKSVLWICDFCHRPSYFEQLRGANKEEQFPKHLPGRDVEGLPDDDVAVLFREVRLATQAGAHNAAIVCGRNLLLRIAWDQGADQDISKFEPAIEYLVGSNKVQESLKPALERIRQDGNTVTHNKANASPDDSALMVDVLTDVLQSLYGTKARLAKHPQIPRM